MSILGAPGVLCSNPFAHTKKEQSSHLQPAAQVLDRCCLVLSMPEDPEQVLLRALCTGEICFIPCV